MSTSYSRRKMLRQTAGLVSLASLTFAGLTPAIASANPDKPKKNESQKSAKRGIAYDLADPNDLIALSPGVSWWYNWSPSPNASIGEKYPKKFDMDFYPMLWNDPANYDLDELVHYLRSHPHIDHLLVLNEPNLTDQANCTPDVAAQLWPGYEEVAARARVKIVGPQMTFGTMPNYGDPTVWMDAFYAEYQERNQGRLPRIDYLGIHWYDFGLTFILNYMAKYNKPYWVTEFANWHTEQYFSINTLQQQIDQMTDMVNTCETRDDVFRYAWFTGRLSPDPHYTSLLAGPGQLSQLGEHYISLPFTYANSQNDEADDEISAASA